MESDRRNPVFRWKNLSLVHLRQCKLRWSSSTPLTSTETRKSDIDRGGREILGDESDGSFNFGVAMTKCRLCDGKLPWWGLHRCEELMGGGLIIRRSSPSRTAVLRSFSANLIQANHQGSDPVGRYILYANQRDGEGTPGVLARYSLSGNNDRLEGNSPKPHRYHPLLPWSQLVGC